jgi:hypothetical protein
MDPWALTPGTPHGQGSFFERKKRKNNKENTVERPAR